MPPKKKPKGKPRGDAPGGGSGAPKTVGAMLAALGIADPASSFEACANFEDEFRVVKKAYLKVVLKEHPDKGGDRERFEAVQTAWETLSSMKAENKLGSLRSTKTASTSAAKEHAHAAAHRPSSTPDWSFYAEAFKESEIPLYKVERAKSGRSRCEMREKDATDTKKPTKRRAYTVCRSTVADKNSKCFIAKNHVRIGIMDVVSGAYGRFVHVECWRVPATVYRGLPSPTVEKNVDAFKSALAAMEDVSLAGARALDDEGLALLARHVMDPEHWARGAKKRLPDEPGAGAAAKKAKKAKSEPDAATVAAKKKAGATRRGKNLAPVPAPPVPPASATVDLTGSSDDENDNDVSVAATLPTTDAKKKRKAGPARKKTPSSTLGALVASGSEATKKKKQTSDSLVVVPRPGVGLANVSAYAGKTVVLTGVFPELGGGAGLNLGKDRARALIESFGGRVTSAVSGKTDVLLCGREPGMSKVSQARARGTTLLSFDQLCLTLESGAAAPAKGSAEALALTEGVNITSFSSGYWGNGLANSASDAALAYAARGPERVTADGGAAGGKPKKPKKRGLLGW